MPERRIKERLAVTFPAIVRRCDPHNHRTQEHAILFNLSTTGVDLRLKRCVEPGTRLFILIYLSSLLSAETQAPSLAVLGTVIRTDSQPDGTFDSGVRLERHRFL